MSEKIVTPESKILEIKKDVAGLEKKMETIAVTEERHVVEATEFLASIKGRIERVEELRKFFVGPLNEQVKTINGMFKEQLAPLAAIDEKVRSVVSAYKLAEIKKEREEEVKKAAKLEKENAKRAKAGKEKVIVPVEVAPKRGTTIKTESGKMTEKVVWEFEVEDVHKIPLKIRKKILDEALKKGVVKSIVKKEVVAGAREIAGVRIYENVTLSVTAKK